MLLPKKPIQYLRSHQHLLIESSRLTGNTNSLQASQLQEPNDIFHSSSSERENSFASMAYGKKRSNSGNGVGIEVNSITGRLSEDYSGATSSKRPKSENGKHSKENIPSPPLPGLHRDSLPLQGITNTGGAIRRSHQPLHWVYPQPQQQHHQQRNSGAWNNPSLSIAVSMASNSLDIHHAAHGQGNNTSTSGSTNHSLMGNNSILDPTSSQILGASGGPPPYIKNGVPGGCGSASNESTTVNEDEWKNIHVMLNCILGMVDKTKKALGILQQRSNPPSTSPTSGLKGVQGNYNTSIQNGVNVGRNGASNQVSSIEGMIGAAGHGAGSYGTEGGADAFARSKLPVSDMLAATLRSTEERVVEVRRRAEEAVLEVKRVAMAEMQRAVTLAERRALDSVTNERIKMERLLIEAASMSGVPSGSISSTSSISTSSSRKPDINILDAAMNSERLNRSDKNILEGVKSSSSEEYSCNSNETKQNESSEEPNRATKNKPIASNPTTATICWNCGRTANETCSGCNLARYCSQFCQHKDWELHHKVCSITAAEASSGHSSTLKPIGVHKSEKASELVVGNSMAATLAAAGFNLNEPIDSNDREKGLKTSPKTRSPDNITAATLLAAAAAHAATSSASARLSNQIDSKNVDNNDSRGSSEQEKDKNMEVNVDEDEDEEDRKRNPDNEAPESIVTDERNSTPHDLSRSNELEENRIDSIDNNNKVSFPEESELCPLSQTSSFDKHRRKTKKLEIARNK